jgi:nitroreductase
LDADLYPYLVSRRSIRSYDQRPFESADKARIELTLNNTRALFPENQFNTIFHTKEKGEDLVSVLGAYGRFITPPYYLLPYIIGENQVYVDLGYQAEQIAIQLWSKGIGSCFIGCLSRQEKVRVNFHLPSTAHIAAFLVIGYPGDNLGFETITKTAMSIMGIRSRFPIEEISFLESFDLHFKPNGMWEKIIEAGRMAPSAVNAQPWRFLLIKNELYLFSVQNSRKYLLAENSHYSFHDCGICMANIDMALLSLGVQGKWKFLNGNLDKNLKYPENYYPLVKLTVGKLEN